ncbi:glycosyl hydrolase family 8 [Mucilaginibacter antarcticus]|uniref:Glucanase n=1 Tax=Mucilaginibacter antarcticus TaxID=1855725 RepID=A0ABW5XK02_9SPHI
MIAIGALSTAKGQSLSKPFPQHTRYFKGCIKPNHVSQAGLDKAVGAFYNQWKKRYIKTIPGKAESYIWFEGKGGKQCVSEGQGYGMVITALMAGHDPSAQKTFDNLLRYCRAHPAASTKYLMAWAQKTNGKDLDRSTATDGDVDIAFSLLLAAKQWGNAGDINYLHEAKARINAIMQHQVNLKTFTIWISDAIEPGSKYYYATRSSDFMPSHLKAFKQVTGDVRWQKVIAAQYKLFAVLQNQHSPDAGLVPDFMININNKPKPAGPDFLESKNDGDYNYNACRVPWRIAVDYLMYGDARAKKFVTPINSWIRRTTNNDTYNLSAGYSLGGNDLKGRYFEALSFIGPFGVSAMAEGKDQVWLNHIWDYLTAFKLQDYDYYDNTIKLLNMLIMSGNYWQ